VDTSSFTWHLYQRGPEEKYEYFVNTEGLVVAKLIFNDGIWAAIIDDEVMGEFISTKNAKIALRLFFEFEENEEETLIESPEEP